MIVRRAIGLEGAEVAIPDGDELVVGIALGGRDGQLEELGGLLVQLFRPPPVGCDIALVAAEDLHLGDGAAGHFQAQHLHGLGAIGVGDDHLRAGVAQALVHGVEAPAHFLRLSQNTLDSGASSPFSVMRAFAACGSARGSLAISAA